MKFLSVIAVVIMLAGCATAPHAITSLPAPAAGISPVSVGGLSHTVRSGETLWGISKQYGVNLKDLVSANKLQDAGVIEKGQVLRIPSGVSRPRQNYRSTVKSDSFLWPVRGYITAPYGSKIDTVKNKGIDIKADEGSAVRASRSGRVVYCDSYMKGFGKTVILDHGDGYQTVYSYNSDILVKVGDAVNQSQMIARVGRTGRAKEPTLHFEIREDGEPHNPAYYLPRI